MRAVDLHARVLREREAEGVAMPDNNLNGRPVPINDDATRLQMLADELDTRPPTPATASFDEYGPLIVRAPKLTSEAIMQIFETAAEHVEATAEQGMQIAVENLTAARATADRLRSTGRLEAERIAKTAEIACDIAQRFREEQKRLVTVRRELADFAVEGAE